MNGFTLFYKPNKAATSETMEWFIQPTALMVHFMEANHQHGGGDSSCVVCFYSFHFSHRRMSANSKRD